jgi:hypothetical protein
MLAYQITTDRIKVYIVKSQHERAAIRTINRELRCLKRIFNLAKQRTSPRVTAVPHFHMLEERKIAVWIFLNIESPCLARSLTYAQMAVTPAYYSGMRMGEVFSLLWVQVNWPDGKLYLHPQDTKTDTPRVLYRGRFAEGPRRKEATLRAEGGQTVHGSVIPGKEKESPISFYAKHNGKPMCLVAWPTMRLVSWAAAWPSASLSWLPEPSKVPCSALETGGDSHL